MSGEKNEMLLSYIKYYVKMSVLNIETNDRKKDIQSL